jgi:hypothetical protein
MTDQAPLNKSLTGDIDALGATADGTTPLGAAPFAGTVASVIYIPSVAITGANTNTRTLNLINKKQDGTGSTVVATLALASGVNPAAFDETPLTLSGTAANLVVAEGDVLAFQSVHASSGLADPGGEVRVKITRG